MAADDGQNFMEFEEGWPVMQEAVDRVVRFIEGTEDKSFTSEDYMRYYTTVFNMCSPNPVGQSSQQLYDQYNRVFEEYIISKREERGGVARNIDQKMVRLQENEQMLSRFFHYLERYMVKIRRLPTLEEAAFLTFYNLVLGETKDQATDAVISMIKRDREKEHINQSLVKKAVGIYVEIGCGSMKIYEGDFEESMFEKTAGFYSHKSSAWIRSLSYQDYMIKVGNSLKHEKDIVCSYLQNRNQKKLVEIVEHELLSVWTKELEEKSRVDETSSSLESA